MVAAVKVTVRLNPAAIDRLVRDPNSPVGRQLVRKTVGAFNRAVSTCPVDKGRLRSAHTWEVRVDERGLVGVIGVKVPYAKAVHDGTGIYGPRGTPIRPVRARVLVFKPKGSATFVFARQVRGMRGRPWLRNAVQATD